LHVKHAMPRTKPVAGSDGVIQSEVVDGAWILADQDDKGSLSRIDVVQYVHVFRRGQFPNHYVMRERKKSDARGNWGRRPPTPRDLIVVHWHASVVLFVVGNMQGYKVSS
jgi:hypothetical protein